MEEEIFISYTKNGAEHIVRDGGDENLTIIKSCADGKRFIIKAQSDIVLKEVSFLLPFSFNSGDKIFANGYQSWSLSREYSLDEYDSSMQYADSEEVKRLGADKYGDSSFYKNAYTGGIIHGYTYGYVRRKSEYTLFASLNEKSGFTRFIFNAVNGTVKIEKDCSGRELLKNEEYECLSFAKLIGEENAVFDKWFSLIGVKSLTNRTLTGYTSWYNYYQDISSPLIRRDLEGLKSLPVKPDVFQIDDGFESAVGDWLKPDSKKFPDGLKPIAEQIKAEGYTAGVWLAPFVCEKKSDVYRDHKDWLVKGEDGEPFFIASLWSGMYALDIYNKEALAYIKLCLKTAVKDWGFTLLKLDFLYAVCLVPRKNKTRGEIMFDAMDIISSCRFGAEILGCGIPLSAAFGKVEYCRVGTDMSLEWEGPSSLKGFHSERPCTRYTMFNSLFRRQLSGRAFISDPDVFILRDYNVSLTKQQRLALGAVNALSGGILFASDDFSRYGKEEKEEYSYLLSLRGGKILSAEITGDSMNITYLLRGEEKLLSYKI